jgi:WD domain, G-beta repeat/WD40-like Beta Propeller Repeat
MAEIKVPGEGNDLCYLPDGRLLVVSEGDAKVWVYEPGGLTPSLVVPGISGRAEDMARSPDGRWIAIVSQGTGVVVELTKGADSRRVTPDSGYLESVAWTADGKQFLTAGARGRIDVWGRQTVEREKVIDMGEKGRTTCIAFSPDNRWVAIGSGHYCELGGEGPPRKKTGDNVIRVMPWSKDAIKPLTSQIVAASIAPPKPAEEPPEPAAPPQPATAMKAGEKASPDEPPLDEVTARLKLIRSQFDVAVERELGPDHAKRKAALSTSYVAAIDRAIAEYAEAVRVDDALFLKTMRESVMSGENPKPDKSAPAQARLLHATYEQQRATLEAQRLQKLRPLYDRYDVALAGFMAELSRAKRLEDALKVKKERDSVLAERDGSAPPGR